MKSRRSTPIFQTLLDPVTIEEFARDYWARESLFVAGSAEKVRILRFGLPEFWDICKAKDLVLTAQFHGRVGHQEIRDIPGVKARELFDAGLTLAIDNVQRFSPALQEITAETKLVLGYPGPVSITCFLSPDETGFNMHFDQHSAFVVQLEGRKSWLHSKLPAVESPPQNLLAEWIGQPDFGTKWRWPWIECKSPGDGDLSEHLLNPGDILYMPPGTWHRPVARGGYSLHFTFAFEATRFEAMLTKLVGDELYRRPGWRAIIPIAPASQWDPPHVPEHIRRFFEARLAELRETLDQLSPDYLAMIWRQMICDERLATAPAPTELTLRSGDQIAVVHPLWFRSAPAREDILVVFSGHRSMRLPVEAAHLLRELAVRSSCRVEDAYGAQMSGGLDQDEVLVVLEALYHEGFISLQQAE